MATDMEHLKRKVLLVSGSNKPIPAAEGGAIESLTEQLVEQSKKNGAIELFVLSEASNSISKSKTYYSFYKNKNYIWKELSRKVHNQICFRKKYTCIKRALLDTVKRINEIEHFDEIIVLNYGIYCVKIRKFYTGKISLFLHNDYLNLKTHKYNKILNSIDRIISVSKFIENKVKTLPNSNSIEFSIVENGIDLDTFKPTSKYERKDLRENLGLSNEHLIFLYSGRVDRSKGVEALITAFELLNDRKAILLVIGEVSSNYKNKFLESVSKSAQDIRLIEALPQNMLLKYYQASDICIIPSIVEESFCLVNIEAQACNLPVIATKSGALADLFYGFEEMHIGTKKNKLVDDLVRSMKFFKENRICLQRINYRKHAEIYSIDNMYKQFIMEVNHS